MSISQIEATFAKTLKKELNVNVEIVCRTESKWTISGTDSDATRAANWLASKGLMSIESIETFDDDDEFATYVYMISN